MPRGKTGGTQKVALPEGYLDHLDDDTAPGRRGRDRGLGRLAPLSAPRPAARAKDLGSLA